MGSLADWLIANGVTIQKWIPVTERLPERFEVVHVYRGCEHGVEIAYKAEGNWWVGLYAFSDVTHWMPLPEPPSGERKENE